MSSKFQIMKELLSVNNLNPPYTNNVTKTKLQKEEYKMANRSSNKAAVPEAKGALDKFKYEVATELGVPLTDGYKW